MAKNEVETTVEVLAEVIVSLRREILALRTQLANQNAAPQDKPAEQKAAKD